MEQKAEYIVEKISITKDATSVTLRPRGSERWLDTIVFPLPKGMGASIGDIVDITIDWPTA